jgi:hypothetical protein
MKNLSGFAPYGFVLFIAVVSVSAVIYGIKARASELVYYKELSNQTSVEVNEFAVCGGPAEITCKDGYSCVIENPSKEAFGNCKKIN